MSNHVEKLNAPPKKELLVFFIVLKKLFLNAMRNFFLSLFLHSLQVTRSC